MTTSLVIEATKAVAAQAPALKEPKAGLLPEVTEVREVSVQVAKAVIRKAVEEGLNQEVRIPTDEAELEEWIRAQMWDAKYRAYRKVESHQEGSVG